MAFEVALLLESPDATGKLDVVLTFNPVFILYFLRTDSAHVLIRVVSMSSLQTHFIPSGMSLTSAVTWRWIAGESDGADSARCGLHHVPSSGHRHECCHHGEFRLGDQLSRIQGDSRRGDPGESALRVAATAPRLHGTTGRIARTPRGGEEIGVMDIHHLVKMANCIGDFFASEPDEEKAAKGVADHIRNFWDPRMRRQIFAHLDQTSGEGISEMVLTALRIHRKELGG